jgi:uridine kinase
MPSFIAIAGGSASGKSTLCRYLSEYGGRNFDFLLLDSYYRCASHLSEPQRARLNYDHPEAFDFDLLVTHLEELRNGNDVMVPEYDFSTHSRAPGKRRAVPAPVVAVEGILPLFDERIRNFFDYSLFVDLDDALRFQRRLARDTRERGRTELSVKEQWEATVQPMYKEFCEPSRDIADEVIDGRLVDRTFCLRLWERLCDMLKVPK